MCTTQSLPTAGPPYLSEYRIISARGLGKYTSIQYCRWTPLPLRPVARETLLLVEISARPQRVSAPFGSGRTVACETCLGVHDTPRRISMSVIYIASDTGGDRQHINQTRPAVTADISTAKSHVFCRRRWAQNTDLALSAIILTLFSVGR